MLPSAGGSKWVQSRKYPYTARLRNAGSHTFNARCRASSEDWPVASTTIAAPMHSPLASSTPVARAPSNSTAGDGGCFADIDTAIATVIEQNLVETRPPDLVGVRGSAYWSP